MKSPSQEVWRCWTSWDFGQSARRDVESTPWKQEGYLGTARKYLRVFVLLLTLSHWRPNIEPFIGSHQRKVHLQDLQERLQPLTAFPGCRPLVQEYNCRIRSRMIPKMR